MAFAPQLRRSARLLALAAFVAVGLAGCASTSDEESRYPEQYGGSERHDPFGRDAEARDQGGLFGPDGIVLFGGDGDGGNGGSGSNAGIGVNSFLWRASLDTVSFMPLTTTDPFGGVIITDWYTTPESPTERFKVTVFILDRRLRADGVRVNVFRQEQNAETNQWADAAVDAEMPVRIENAILTRARQLRVAQFE